MRFPLVLPAAPCLMLATVLMALLVTGCSPHTRHAVLTFFFTGVPPLAEESDGTVPQKTLNRSNAPQVVVERGSRMTRALQGKAGVAPVAPPKQQYYSHRIWLTGRCNACHQGNNLFVFQSANESDERQAERVFYSGGGMPGPLKASPGKLCNGCHSDKTGLRAIKERLWLHNPTAKGDCLACHDPHQSKNSGILRKPAGQICQPCHKDAALAAILEHPHDNRPCLDCHNPHMGKDRRLLRQEYQEVKQPARLES